MSTELSSATTLSASRALAAFASARDARAFAVLKREEGLEVTIKPGNAESPYPFEVHTLVNTEELPARFYDDDKREEFPREPRISPQTGFEEGRL